MRTPALAAVIVALGLLGGCVQPAPTPTPSARPTVVSVDLTAPGQARAMVRRLIAKAGTPRLIQVEITKIDDRGKLSLAPVDDSADAADTDSSAAASEGPEAPAEG